MSIRSELAKTTSYLRSLRNAIIEQGGDLSTTAGLKDLVEAVKTITPTIGIAYELSSDGTYYVCTGLGSATDTNITIASKVNGCPVTEVGNGSFAYSTITSISIPNSVKIIRTTAFMACKSLTSLHIPGTVREIENGAFNACRSLKDDASLNYPPVVTIDEGLEIFGGFNNCSGMRILIIPNSVREMAQSALSKCSLLERLTLSSNLERIGDYALKMCRKITHIDMPAPVNYIGTEAFYECTALTSVNMMHVPNPPTLGTNAFDGCPLVEISVPMASLTAYKSATNWSAYADVMVGYEEDKL